jgi:Rap1a immunity proteins
MPEPKLYEFSTHIGSTCARKMVSFQQAADKLKMDVTELMRQRNAKAPPSRALVKEPCERVGYQRTVPRKACGRGSGRPEWKGKMIKLAPLLLLTITAAALAEARTSAYWTAAEMRDECSTGSEHMEACLWYFQGISDTLHSFQSAGLLSKSTRYCIPSAVKAPELRDVFLKQVADDPTAQHMSAASVALVAFGRAYPCDKQ